MEESKSNRPVDLHAIPEGDNAGTYESFKEKLMQVQKFPSEYAFKFIVTGDADMLSNLKALFPNDELTTKPSKTGKYISVTIVKAMQDADEVVALYKEAGKIKGIMLL